MSDISLDVTMATKTISITEEAYERLRMHKKETESFTDVINKITGKKSIMELAGILSKEEGDKLEKHIKDSRVLSRKRMDRIIKNLK